MDDSVAVKDMEALPFDMGVCVKGQVLDVRFTRIAPR